MNYHVNEPIQSVEKPSFDELWREAQESVKDEIAELRAMDWVSNETLSQRLVNAA